LQAEYRSFVILVGTNESIDPEINITGRSLLNFYTLLKLSQLIFIMYCLILGINFKNGNRASAMSDIPVKVFSMIAP
jgi:hypothetical protein